MDKLLELASLVDCTYSLSFNEHKDYYEPSTEYYQKRNIADSIGIINWEGPIFRLYVYPRTPVRFITAISNDLDSLVDWAIAQVKAW